MRSFSFLAFRTLPEQHPHHTDDMKETLVLICLSVAALITCTKSAPLSPSGSSTSSTECVEYCHAYPLCNRSETTAYNRCIFELTTDRSDRQIGLDGGHGVNAVLRRSKRMTVNKLKIVIKKLNRMSKKDRLKLLEKLNWEIYVHHTGRKMYRRRKKNKHSKTRYFRVFG